MSLCPALIKTISKGETVIMYRGGFLRVTTIVDIVFNQEKCPEKILVTLGNGEVIDYLDTGNETWLYKLSDFRRFVNAMF